MSGYNSVVLGICDNKTFAYRDPMSKLPFAISSKRVLTPNGLTTACVIVRDGNVVGVTEANQTLDGCHVVDVGNSVVMPGLVDSHVHVNEPGRTEWEGFESATKAAAAGGITTIADMPLNSDPVTTNYEALQHKLASAKGKIWVDCAFYGGVVPGNAGVLEQMARGGVSGFKCFLIHSGLDEFPNVNEDELRLAMPILQKLRLPLLVHAELCHNPHQHDLSEKPLSYRAFLNSRPRQWENDAIELMIALCREYKCAVHIVHLSSSEALPSIRAAKNEGLPLTVETCPHYLTFAAEEISDGDPRFKCAPPIREAENRELLWQAVLDRTIDFIVSDHSPCTPELKFLDQGDLAKAWGGISSLQFGLPAIWTSASRRGATIADLVRWLSAKPAEFLNLSARKGALAPGYDADIVIWNPEEEFAINAGMIHHRHKITPYDGMKLIGKVEQTYVGGKKVYDHGKHSDTAYGQLLLRTTVESEK